MLWLLLVVYCWAGCSLVSLCPSVCMLRIQMFYCRNLMFRQLITDKKFHFFILFLSLCFSLCSEICWKIFCFLCPFREANKFFDARSMNMFLLFFFFYWWRTIAIYVIDLFSARVRCSNLRKISLYLIRNCNINIRSYPNSWMLATSYWLLAAFVYTNTHACSVIRH